jgi:NADH-quinone oxidoreductase subunit J
MDIETAIFYLLGGFTLLSALCVILFSNPIFCALSLAMAMTGVAVIFFSMGAYFVAGVQLIVYAGAVIVMFVMVVMLIDLKQEKTPFSKGAITTFLKVFSAVLVGATLVSSAAYSVIKNTGPIAEVSSLQSTRAVAELIFTKYLFGFEAIGVLLLVVLIGAIALSRARGGTHA